jgi:glucosamine--fructose-6-phosphate aminotransferase (isomerizing)
MNNPQPAEGCNTAAEILSQPRCWQQCLDRFEKDRSLERILEHLDLNRRWLFIGCGSSYYIALAAAATWTHMSGLDARAVPASEVLLFPDLALPGDGQCQPVLISRSGHTSEVLKAAEYLESIRGIRTIAISCAAGQPLERIASATLHVLPADEKSMVMTRSFTSMLLGLQALAAQGAQKADFMEDLKRLPSRAQASLDAMRPQIEAFVRSRAFSDYAFLGQGPLFGLASEGQLKVKEMSCSYAQVYHTLEFRHGPKAIVGPETLLTFLISDTGCHAEREVLEDMKGLGATTFVITNRADNRLRAASDLLVELKLDVAEYARMPAFAMALQLLGLYTGIGKGLDPDRPRNLSRVVILDSVS